jgi:hypothetical protein
VLSTFQAPDLGGINLGMYLIFHNFYIVMQNFIHDVYISFHFENYNFPGAANRSQVGEFWGRKFRWTSHLPSRETLYTLKFTDDKLADECLEKLNAIKLKADDDGETVEGGLFALLQHNVAKDHKLQRLWDQGTTVPDWVDWKQIERGQEIFYRYGMANSSAVCDSFLTKTLF